AGKSWRRFRRPRSGKGHRPDSTRAKTARPRPRTAGTAQAADDNRSFDSRCASTLQLQVVLVNRLIHLGTDEADQVLRTRALRQSPAVRNVGHCASDAQRDVSNPSELRIDSTLRQLFLGDVIRQRPRGFEEHFVGYQPSAAGEYPKAEPGEDVRIVSLTWNESPTVQSHGPEWAATRKNRAAFGPAISLLRRALGLRGGIGKSEDDRSMVDARHRRDDGPAEHPGRSRYPDQRSGPMTL